MVRVLSVWSLSALGTGVSPAKMHEPIEMRFGGASTPQELQGSRPPIFWQVFYFSLQRNFLIPLVNLLTVNIYTICGDMDLPVCIVCWAETGTFIKFVIQLRSMGHMNVKNNTPRMHHITPFWDGYGGKDLGKRWVLSREWKTPCDRLSRPWIRAWGYFHGNRLSQTVENRKIGRHLTAQLLGC